MNVIHPNSCFLSIKINKQHIQALCDSGCVTSCLSEKFARRLNLKITPPLPNTTNLVSANNSPIHNLGNAEVSLCIQGLVIPYEFVVLRDLSQDVILGQNFFEETKTVINYGTREISISLFDNLICAPLNTKTHKTSLLRMSQDIILPPLNEAIISIHTPSIYNDKQCLIEGMRDAIPNTVLVAAAVVSPSRSTTICRIANVANVEYRIRKGTPIATISTMNMNDPETQRLLTMDQQATTLPSKKNVVMPSHEERLNQLKKLGLSLENSNLTLDEFQQLTALLYEFREIFCNNVDELPISTLPEYTVPVDPNVKPIRQKRYPLPPIHERILEKYVDKLLKAGIVEECENAWNAPAILVRKHQSTVGHVTQPDEDIKQHRLVLDFRRHNSLINHSFQPMTDLATIVTQVSETHPKYFSQFDFSQSFWQINLAPGISRDITSFSTKTRHLRFRKAPQGLSCSPAAFLGQFYSVFRPELQQSFVAYVDDGLTFSNTFSEQMDILSKIFVKLQRTKLRINPSKSFFCTSSAEMLGFEFNSNGIRIAQSRFKKIRDIQPPRNVKEIKMLSGLFSYFRRFIPGFSILMANIRELLKKDVKFNWTEQHTKSLEKIKELILSNATLAYPNMNETMFVQSDASSAGISHALLQRQDGKFKVIAVGGRSFKKHEKVLSSCDSELIGIMDAIHCYRQFIHNGRPFKILTDSLSMTYIKNLSYEKSPRLTRYALLLQNLDFEIEHIKGTSNILPDFFSRYQLEDNESPIDKVPTNSILDVDHYGFLNAIDIQEITNVSHEEDKVKNIQVPRRKYKSYAIMPIIRDQKTAERERIRQTQTTHEDILDELEQQSLGGATSNISPLVNLDNQADNPLITAVITYLRDGHLPLESTLAKDVLFQAPDFFIHDNQLFHLARLSKKNKLNKLMPRYEQLVIPFEYRMQVMKTIHDSNHIGFSKAYLTARTKFFWSTMQQDFKDYTESCTICRQVNSAPTTQFPINAIPVASRLFECIQIDYHSIPTHTRGSRPDPDKYKHVLVVVDQLSQYCIMVPAKDQTSATTAQLLFDNWILRFGAPSIIISDRSQTWLSEVFQSFLKMSAIRVDHRKTSPYHARTNGLCEALNKYIVKGIRIHCYHKENFHEFLPLIAAGINNTVNTALGVSPFFMLYGMEYKSPIDVTLTRNDQPLRSTNTPEGLQKLAERMQTLRELIRSNVMEFRKCNNERTNRTLEQPKFTLGQRVFLNQKFDTKKPTNVKHSPQFVGPYVLVDERGPQLFKVQHFATGKVLKNWINAEHFRTIPDHKRERLLQRIQRTDEPKYAEQPNIQQQLAITGTALQETAAENMNTNETPPIVQKTVQERKAKLTENHYVYNPELKAVTAVKKQEGNLYCRVIYHTEQHKPKWIPFNEVQPKLIAQYYLDKYRKIQNRIRK
jgi:RNase H-like domain found in reverse transcriptase/Reverse transcriptase (RNA-dependent DNA polymerase)/Integrase zinc binding domain/gag-polyprotein putative aspartyl protease/Integrase core domain